MSHSSAMYRYTLFVYLVFAIWLAGAERSSAQGITGVVDNTNIIPTPGTGHEYIQALNEIVDPSNGSVSVRVPAPVPHERGNLNFPVWAFLYNSSGQYQLQPNFQAWPPTQHTPGVFLQSVLIQSSSGYTGGGIITGAPTQYNTQGAPPSQGQFPPGTVSRQHFILTSNPQYRCDYSTNYIYTDANGAAHPLGLFYYSPNYYAEETACNYYQVQGPGVNITTNAYGDYIGVIGSSGYAYVYDTSGNQLSPSFGVEDSNGNNLDGTGRTYSYNGDTLTIPGLANSYTIAFQQTGTSNFDLDLNSSQINGYAGTGCPTSITPLQNSSHPVGNTIITLPNSQEYVISWDPNYGTVSQITYPTGATVTYTWILMPQSQSEVFYDSNAFGGSVTCGYRFGWPAVSKRVVSYDGVHPAEEQDFSYATTWSSSGWGWTAKTTTVTTKDLVRPGTPSYNTVYTYSPQNAYVPPGAMTMYPSQLPVENTIAYYDTAGNLLRTVTKSWYDASSSTSISLLAGECTTLPNGRTNGIFYSYWRVSHNVMDKAEYDYGSVTTPCVQPSSTPKRETKTTYQTFGSSPLVPGTATILNRPASVQVYDNGTEISETDYSYDQTAVSTVSPSALAHDETNYGSSSTAPRGNLTSVTQKCLKGCTVSPVTQYGYDETGQVVSITDPKANPPTTLSYSDNYASGDGSPSGNTNTYLTKRTNALSQSDTYSFGFEDGKLRSHTDVNQQTTSFCYYTGGCSGSIMDPWARLTEVDAPDKGKSNYTYSDAGPNPYTTASVLINSSTSKSVTTTFDAYGHAIQTDLTSDPYGADLVAMAYDGVGRLYTQSNAYRTGTPVYTTYTYDSLGRMTQETHPDGSALQWCYDGVPSSCPGNLSSNPNVSWVNSYDETGRYWQRASDGLGRIVAAMEPDGSTTVGKTPSLETDYQYDALSDLLRVDQWGGPNGSTGDRVRTILYDSLGRLTSACDPESIPSGSSCSISGPWSHYYTYDANGNVLNDTDSRSLTIQYSYDALNRLQVQTNPSGTPNACFWYDTSSVSSPPSGCPALPAGITSGGSLVGRKGYQWTSDGLTAKGYSYDAMGRINAESVCTPSTCGHKFYSLAFQYDLTGDQTSYTNGFGYRTTLGYDAADRLTQVTSTPTDANHPGTLWTANSYDPVGLSQATLGNGIVQKIARDNRERISSQTFTDPSNQNVYSFNLGYFANSSIQTANDSANGNWTYSLDNMNRLYTASATSGPFSGTALQWTIDSWGNRNVQKVTAGSGPQPTFSSTMNNQIAGYCYDNAGHLLDEGPCPTGVHQFTYDGAGRLISPDHGNTSYVYDAEGDRAAKQVGGVSTFEYLYDLGDHQITEITNNGSGWSRGEVFAGELHVATYYDATTFFSHTDWLGNERVHSTVNATVRNTCSNLPFGDSLSCTSEVTPLNYTGKQRDIETGYANGDDYFGARYYASNMGRWTSPDWSESPAGIPYVDIENPQSLNLYGFVLNNPLRNRDTDGHVWKCGPQFTTITKDGLVVNANCHDEPAWWDLPGWAFTGFANLAYGDPLQGLRQMAYSYSLGVPLASVGVGLNAASGLTSLGLGTAAATGTIQGLFGTVSVAELEAAASSGGETITVVTDLSSAPTAGRALSVATGEGADALAGQASGATRYIAQLPKKLVDVMLQKGLAQRSLTNMGGAQAQEIRFYPQATQFVVKFFKSL